MKKILIISGIVLAAIGIGAFVLINNKGTNKPTETSEEKTTDQENSSISEELNFKGTKLAGTSSPLLDFNQEDYEKALKTDKLILIYFYANWCPICKREVANALYPAFNELVGDDVIGFRVNFNDSETDSDEVALAREHGIAYQHTKVFIKNGQRVLKSPDEWNKARYLSEIDKNK